MALVGNAADVVPRLLADGVEFDVVTDQTAAHDPLRGYVPRGFTPARAADSDPEDPAFRSAVFDSLAAHVEAMLGYLEQGAVVFEYGNGLRAQAAAHGVEQAAAIPGFVSAYVRPIFARGVGPFRWICLSGDPADLRRSEDVLHGDGRNGLAALPGSSWRVNGCRCRDCPRGSAGSGSASATGWRRR